MLSVGGGPIFLGMKSKLDPIDNNAHLVPHSIWRLYWGVLLAVLFTGVGHAGTSPVGAGSYEVYMGSAFYTHELADKSSWAYVAGSSDGLYWHPVGYNQGATYKNATPAEWKIIASSFASRNVVVEGDMNDGKATGDLGTIKLVKSLGLVPTVSLVNRIKDTAGSWGRRVDTNFSQGVESYTMIAPHRMETAPKGFFDTTYDHAREMILAGNGTSVDAPTFLFIHHSEKYRKSIFDAITWAHANKRKFCYLISPNESSDSFLVHAQMLTRTLEDSGVVPDQFGVELYGLRPYTLTPETVVGKSGKPVSANTITGVAHWLLKHARADEGELDLWLVGPDGKVAGKGTVSEDLAKVGAVAVRNWKGVKGTFTFTAQIQNRSDWLDFVPALRARVAGASGWTVRFEVGGVDVSKEVLATGYGFSRKDRLWPGITKTVTIVLSKPGAVTLPAALEIDFQLAPMANSRFVRDVARIRLDTITASVAGSPRGFASLGIRRDGAQLVLTGLPAGGFVELRDSNGKLVFGQTLSGQTELGVATGNVHGLAMVRVGFGGQYAVSRIVLP